MYSDSQFSNGIKLPWHPEYPNARSRSVSIQRAIPATLEGRLTTPLHMAMYQILAHNLPPLTPDTETMYRIFVRLAVSDLRGSPLISPFDGMDGSKCSACSRLVSLTLDLARDVKLDLAAPRQPAASSLTESVDSPKEKLMRALWLIAVLVGSQSSPASELFNLTASSKSPCLQCCLQLVNRLTVQRPEGCATKLISLNKLTFNLVDLAEAVAEAESAGDKRIALRARQVAPDDTPFALVALVLPLLALTYPTAFALSTRTLDFSEFWKRFSGVVTETHAPRSVGEDVLSRFFDETPKEASVVSLCEMAVRLLRGWSYLAAPSIVLSDLEAMQRRCDLRILLVFALEAARVSWMFQRGYASDPSLDADAIYQVDSDQSPSLFTSALVSGTLCRLSESCQYFFVGNGNVDILDLVVPVLTRLGLPASGVATADQAAQFSPAQLGSAAYRCMMPLDPLAEGERWLSKPIAYIRLSSVDAQRFPGWIEDAECSDEAESPVSGSDVQGEEKQDVLNPLLLMDNEDELEGLMQQALVAARRTTQHLNTANESVQEWKEEMKIRASDVDELAFGETEGLSIDLTTLEEDSSSIDGSPEDGNGKGEALRKQLHDLEFEHPGDIGLYHSALRSILHSSATTNGNSAAAFLGLHGAPHIDSEERQEGSSVPDTTATLTHTEIDIRTELLAAALGDSGQRVDGHSQVRVLVSESGADALFTKGRSLRIGAQRISPWAFDPQGGIQFPTQTVDHATRNLIEVPSKEQKSKTTSATSTDMDFGGEQQPEWVAAPGDIIYDLEKTGGLEIQTIVPGSIWDQMLKGQYGVGEDDDKESSLGTEVKQRDHLDHWLKEVQPTELTELIDTSKAEPEEHIISLDDTGKGDIVPGSLWDRMEKGVYQTEPLVVDVGSDELPSNGAAGFVSDEEQ